MDQLYAYLLPLYERGLDAVLVQDFGVLQFVRSHFPGLAIHASTQMTITGVEGVRLVQQLGVERVVVAREMSLDEIRQISEETDVELEAFVHGALCYCYSGQCLLSSMIGGRSGNRGRCAQPCRLAYSVLDENHREYRKESYVLSLKDMCGIGDLKRLREAGVCSLKIEGRMKQAAYAAGVVSVYRRNIDRLLVMAEDEPFSVSESELRKLEELGSRCGFTDAYFARQNGADMVTFDKPGYEQKNEALSGRMMEQYAGGADKIVVAGLLTLHIGEPAVYEVKSGDASFCVRGMEVMEAQKKPLSAEDVRSRMEKTGDTPFAMGHIAVEMDGNVFLPNGALNQLRRDALVGLQEELLRTYRRGKTNCQPDIKTGLQSKTMRDDVPRLVVLTEERAHLPLICGNARVNAVYLDYAAYGLTRHPMTDGLTRRGQSTMEKTPFVESLAADAATCRAAEKEVFFALPRIFRSETEAWFERISGELAAIGFDGFLVRTCGEIAYVRKHFPDSQMVIDHNLYTYNDRAGGVFAGLGAVRNTIPVELNRNEIRHRYNNSSEMIIYGYYPLMTSAQCVHANTAGCDGKPGLCYLGDRRRMQFPVKNVCGACYNVVYNSLPVLLFEHSAELQNAGIGTFRLDFTVEKTDQVRSVLQLVDDFASGRCRKYPAEWQDSYTNGHYKRGVE
jgi:putative protease